MSRRKVLPLVSSNWLPLKDAYDRLRQRLGSEILALEDLNAAIRRGDVRTKERWPGDDQDGRQLSPDFWDNYKIGYGRDYAAPPWRRTLDELLSPAPELGVQAQDSKLGGGNVQVWIYVWGPDFKKIGGGEVAPAAEIEEASKTPAKMGAPTVYDWVEITAEIAWRCYHEKQAPGKRARAKFADDIAEWCIRRFKKAPDQKNILKAIAVVMNRLD